MPDQDIERLPSYAELLARDDAPSGSNWGLFGEDDQLGTVNFLTPDKIRTAAALVRQGKVFPLSLPLHLPSPPLFNRGAHEHQITRYENWLGHDDHIDNLYPQASSHWDALSHIGHPKHGLYNRVQGEQVTGGEGTRLGIDPWARQGIVGRGVLLDVARHLNSEGTPLQPDTDHAIGVEVLEATARAQGVDIRPGDILLVRTGWLKFYLEANQPERDRIARDLKSPGLAAGHEMAGWMWDHRIAAVAADSPALETWPWNVEPGALHILLLCYLGMPLGEMWDMESLAEDCARDGVFEFMLTSAPLNLRGGVGSPSSALAIK